MASSASHLVAFVCLQLLVAGDSWIIEDISARRQPKRADFVSGRPQKSVRNGNPYGNNELKYARSGMTYQALVQTADDKGTRRIENGGRRTEDGTRRTGNDVRRQGRGERRQENGKRRAKTVVRRAKLSGGQSEDRNKPCPVLEVFPVNSGIPCNITPTEAPMFVYFSFDDAITSWNIRFYRQLFSDERRNPDQCPIRATFFNSDPNTEYGLLRELYLLKHEVASHSVSHRGPSTWWSINATKRDWYDEIVGQRKNIHRRTAAVDGGDDGVPLAEIRGMRAPFLALGGDVQFGMLERNGFLYDSSIPNNNRRPSWPFTLHDPEAMNGPICRSRYCPLEPHNVWEVVMNVYFLNDSGSITPCSMIDGCRPPDGRQGALRFLRSNFRRHHQDKVPFGINMHAAWFAFDGYLEAMMAFIDEILDLDDVYIVPIHRLIDWIKRPTTLTEMKQSKFSC